MPVPPTGVHIGPSAILGVGISAAGQSGSGGLPVRSVLRGGPADVVGLRPGDVIRNIDGVPIDSANALTGLLDQRYPGNVIDARLGRPGRGPQNAKVTLAPGPVS